jgi:GNAT superfamily N-acetyltransferase
MSLERLGSSPTRYLTGQFVAALAHKRTGTVAPGGRRWTPGAALARAAEVMREEGPRALTVAVLGETVYRRLALVERDLAAPAGRIRADLQFGFLDEGGLDGYDRLRPGQGPQAAARLAAGHRCFATWLNGKLAAVRWLASGSAHIDYLDLRLTLAPGEIYHYDMFTDPSLRRRGISASSQEALFLILREEGYLRIVRAILPENRAAVRDAESTGYRIVGRVGYVRVGSWRRTFRRASG